MPPHDDAIAFAEKLLLLLDEASFTSTYKYAVLLGLIDLCLEHTDRKGHAPDSVTTSQLADKVLALYWPHAVSFDAHAHADAHADADAGRVLLQSQRTRGRATQAEMLTAIARFRAEHAPDASATLTRARAHAPRAFEKLRREVEWKLIEMPLPRLQNVGSERLELLYAVNWTDRVKRGDLARGFDNLIRFVPGASEHLVRLAGLLRPLVQRQWAAMVARLNAEIVPDARLEQFLFGVDRVALEPVRRELRSLQDDRCFYCEGRLGQDAEVDHFIPWARTANNAIENLVVADHRCNHAKSDYLADVRHVERWVARGARHAEDLTAIAERRAWESRSAESLAVARGIYLRLPEDVRLWAAPRSLVVVDREEIRRAFAA